MLKMKRVCIFCGSSPGISSEYAEAARRLGRALADRKIGLVYGGSNVGLLGSVACGAREAGGEVIGVMPKTIVDMKITFDGLSDFHVVEGMHERLALLAELSDGFIALPGGIGTVAEILEILMWRQLGMHQKPCGLLNTCHYFDRLDAFLDYAVDRQFLKAADYAMVLMEEDPEVLLDRLGSYRAPGSTPDAARDMGVSRALR